MSLILSLYCEQATGQTTKDKVEHGIKKGARETKEGIKKGAQETKKGVKKGAHEVAEQASELHSKVVDKEVGDKMGPNGEDIFYDNDGRYYYVDEKGHRVYLNASVLRQRPPKNDKD